MQIPIVNGIYTDNAPSARISYPVNLTPVIQPNGVSNGFLRPSDGIELVSSGPGVDRGGIIWNDTHYRVMGTKLVSVTEAGAIATLGDVGGSGQVSMDYSFDRLCVVSSGNAYLWDGSSLVQITDPDLGTVHSVRWVDGYFMFTDGEFLIVSELLDPTSIDPLKYGSAEIDPDVVQSVQKIRNEAHAVGRHTIEVYRNIGGTGFPFQRIQGAQIQKGAVGINAVCKFDDESLAFVGGGRNEPVGVYFGYNGTFQKISSREIDELLNGYTDLQLSNVVIEFRTDRNSRMLYVHCADRCLVFDAEASKAMGTLVWHVLTSGVGGFSTYRARNFTFYRGKYWVGDPTTSNLGTLTGDVGSQWGDVVRWEFGTQIIYNESRGAIFNELELVALTGSVAQGVSPVISTSYSEDGQNWSQDKEIAAGGIGDRLKRLVWRRQGIMRSMRMQRFRGDSQSHISFLRLDAQFVALNR